MSLSAKQIDAVPAMTLSELEKSQGASVWVFNLTGAASVVAEFPRGIINIAINDGIGNTIGIKIPITWVPVDMTTQVTKSALIANPQFRRLVSAGALKVVSEEHALQIISTPEGRKETMRVHASEKYTGDLEIKHNNDVVVDATDINGIVMSIVTRDDLDEESSIRILEGHEIALNSKDFEYLAKNSKFAGVKDWAISRL